MEFLRWQLKTEKLFCWFKFCNPCYNKTIGQLQRGYSLMGKAFSQRSTPQWFSKKGDASVVEEK